MRAFHSQFAYVVVAANLIVGAWGLALWRRNREATRTYWTALGIAWGTIYVQGLLGLTMFQRYKPPFKHHFYGFLFAIITVAVFPIRSESPRTRLLVFSVATLFIGIVAVRAVLSL
ncbi:MAG TPA: hypothetical protein VFA34_17045 [Actinomycetota bacterium]|jgi:hypothetical protein|nr:hypothetical protein [Actinomycetota bacterium]